MSKKEKLAYECKFYILEMENGEYLYLNATEEETEKFLTVKDLSKATLFNKENLQSMREVIRAFTGRLFIGNERQFYKPIKVHETALVQLGTSDF